MARCGVFLSVLLLMISSSSVVNVNSKRKVERAGYHMDHLKEVVGKRYLNNDDYDNEVDNVKTWTWVNSAKQRRRLAYDPHSQQREYKEMQKSRKFGRAAGRRDHGHPRVNTPYGRMEYEERLRIDRNERLRREPERVVQRERRADRGSSNIDGLQEDFKRHRNYPGRRHTRNLARERNGFDEDRKQSERINRRKKEDGVGMKGTAKERKAKTTDKTLRTGKKRRQKGRGSRNDNIKDRPRESTDRPNEMERKGRKHPKGKGNDQLEHKTTKQKRLKNGNRKSEEEFLNQTLFTPRKLPKPDHYDSEKRTRRVKGKRKEIKSTKKGKIKKTKVKTVKPKPTKKSQMVKIVIGNGLKSAVQRGNCSISHTIPINEGNAFVLSGTNMLQGSICNYNIKAPSGSTVTVDCPVFHLHRKGCSKESIILTNAGTTTKYCGNSGPVNWVSSSNKVHILHRRTKTKNSKSGCSYSFVCKVSITGSNEKDKLVGFDSDCKQTFNMASGEAAVVFSINGRKKRNCTHNFKGPQGTLFNISCPFVDIGGEGYCIDSLKITDTGASSSTNLCKGTKSFPQSTTLTHMVEFHHKRAKSKTDCSGGYFCKITVIESFPVKDEPQESKVFDEKELSSITENCGIIGTKRNVSRWKWN